MWAGPALPPGRLLVPRQATPLSIHPPAAQHPQAAPESACCSTRRRSAQASRSRAATFSSTARRRSSCGHTRQRRREHAQWIQGLWIQRGRSARTRERSGGWAAKSSERCEVQQASSCPHLRQVAGQLLALAGVDALDGRLGGNVLLRAQAQLRLQQRGADGGRSRVGEGSRTSRSRAPCAGRVVPTPTPPAAPAAHLRLARLCQLPLQHRLVALQLLSQQSQRGRVL